MPEIIQNALAKIRELKVTDEGLFTSDISMVQALALVIQAVKELDDARQGAPKVAGNLSHKPDNFSVSDLL